MQNSRLRSCCALQDNTTDEINHEVHEGTKHFFRCQQAPLRMRHPQEVVE